MNYKLKFVFAMLIVAVGMDYAYTTLHESAHYEIAEKYGCHEIEVSLNYFDPKVISTCTFDSEEERLSYKESQSNVESFGYQLKPIMWAMLLMVFLIGMVMMRND